MKLGSKSIILKGEFIFIAIPILFIIVFFCFPLITVFFRSLDNNSYEHIFKTRLYFQLIINTFKISFFVTIICFIIGFPFARLLINFNPRVQKALLGILLFPLITPLLIRTFSWMVLLQNTGVINQILKKLGITHESLELMFNFTGNAVGLIHVFLPYTVFVLFDSFKRINRSQIMAARTLGGFPFRVFFKIEIPQLASGIFVSNALVFILCSGAFITPAMLGGRKETMVSQVIQERTIYGAFSLAAALSVIFIFCILLMILIIEKTIGFKKIFNKNGK